MKASKYDNTTHFACPHRVSVKERKGWEERRGFNPPPRVSVKVEKGDMFPPLQKKEGKIPPFSFP